MLNHSSILCAAHGSQACLLLEVQWDTLELGAAFEHVCTSTTSELMNWDMDQTGVLKLCMEGVRPGH